MSTLGTELTQNGIHKVVVINTLLSPAGSVISLFRMGLWVTLLVIDLPWLTANDTGISGTESLFPFAVNGALTVIALTHFSNLN